MVYKNAHHEWYLLVNYSYLADGTKFSALDDEGRGLEYHGSLTFRKVGASRQVESREFSCGRSGEVVEANDYYAFGSRWETSSSSGTISNRYRFNGKEDQEGEFGVPTLDYGARHYTPSSARWLSMDPLAEKYYGVSPYVFCNNDPVNFVDPDGRGIYSIDPDGKISKINDDEKVHQLHLVDKDGNTTGKMIELSNSEAMEFLKYEKGKEIYSYTASEGNIDNVFKIFEFAANNTKLEWALHRGQDNRYTVGTISSTTSAGNWEDYGLAEMPISSVHSHPDEPNSFDHERSSMSYDYNNVTDEDEKYGRQMRLNYVYFPNSTRLYHVEPSGIRYIHSISNNYRRFYFGTLNHR